MKIKILFLVAALIVCQKLGAMVQPLPSAAVPASNPLGKSSPKLSTLLRSSRFARLCRNAVEVACIPELYYQIALYKDIILGVGACASESVLAFAPAACAASGGFLVFSLADLGLTIYDLWHESGVEKELVSRYAPSKKKSRAGGESKEE